MRSFSRRPVRLAALTAAVVGLSALSGVPAGAALSSYQLGVVSYGALPSGFGTADVCRTGPGDGVSSFTYVEDVDAAHPGSGALQVATTPDSSAPGGAGFVTLPVSSSIVSLGSLRAKYRPLGGWAPWIEISVLDPARPDYRIRVIAPGTTTAGWQTLDLFQATNLVVLETDGLGSTTTSTVANFPTYRATRTSYWVVTAALGTTCATASSARWDGVSILIDSIETTYDLEPSVDSALMAASAAPASVVSGSATTVSGALLRTSDSTGVVGTAVELWGKPTGAADFSKVTTVTSGTGGALSASVRPTTTTSYRWQLPSASTFAATASAAVPVATKPALTLNRVASSVTYPAPVVLFGAVRPGVAGTVVTLKRSGTSTTVATTTVRSDGAFAFSRKLPRGTYTFWVAVPATPGQSAATSAKVSVKVA